MSAASQKPSLVRLLVSRRTRCGEGSQLGSYRVSSIQMPWPTASMGSSMWAIQVPGFWGGDLVNFLAESRFQFGVDWVQLLGGGKVLLEAFVDDVHTKKAWAGTCCPSSRRTVSPSWMDFGSSTTTGRIKGWATIASIRSVSGRTLWASVFAERRVMVRMKARKDRLYLVILQKYAGWRELCCNRGEDSSV